LAQGYAVGLYCILHARTWCVKTEFGNMAYRMVWLILLLQTYAIRSGPSQQISNADGTNENGTEELTTAVEARMKPAVPESDIAHKREPKPTSSVDKTMAKKHEQQKADQSLLEEHSESSTDTSADEAEEEDHAKAPEKSKFQAVFEARRNPLNGHPLITSLISQSQRASSGAHAKWGWWWWIWWDRRRRVPPPPPPPPIKDWVPDFETEYNLVGADETSMEDKMLQKLDEMYTSVDRIKDDIGLTASEQASINTFGGEVAAFVPQAEEMVQTDAAILEGYEETYQNAATDLEGTKDQSVRNSLGQRDGMIADHMANRYQDHIRYNSEAAELMDMMTNIYAALDILNGEVGITQTDVIATATLKSFQGTEQAATDLKTIKELAKAEGKIQKDQWTLSTQAIQAVEKLCADIEAVSGRVGGEAQDIASATTVTLRRLLEKAESTTYEGYVTAVEDVKEILEDFVEDSEEMFADVVDKAAEVSISRSDLQEMLDSIRDTMEGPDFASGVAATQTKAGAATYLVTSNLIKEEAIAAKEHADTFMCLTSLKGAPPVPTNCYVAMGGDASDLSAYNLAMEDGMHPAPSLLETGKSDMDQGEGGFSWQDKLAELVTKYPTIVAYCRTLLRAFENEPPVECEEWTYSNDGSHWMGSEEWAKTGQNLVDSSYTRLERETDTAVTELTTVLDEGAATSAEAVRAAKEGVDNRYAETKAFIDQTSADSAKSVEESYAIEGNITTAKSDTELDERNAGVEAQSATDTLKARLEEIRESVASKVKQFKDLSVGTITGIEQQKQQTILNLEAPVTEKLDTVLKNIAANLDSATDTQETALGALDESLIWIEQQLGIYRGGHKGLNSLEKMGLSSIERGYSDLASQTEARNNTKNLLEQKTGLQTMNVLLEVDGALSDFKKNVRDHLRERDRLIYEMIGKTGRGIQAVSGEASANEQEMSASMRYAKGRVEDLGTTVADTLGINQRSSFEVETSVSEIQSALTELRSSGQRSMDHAITSQRGNAERSLALDNEFVDTVKSSLTKNMRAETSATGARVDELGNKIVTDFSANVNAFDLDINQLSGNSENTQFQGLAAVQKYEETNERLAKDAVYQVAAADRTVQEEEKATANIERDGAYMHDAFITSAASGLTEGEKLAARSREQMRIKQEAEVNQLNVFKTQIITQQQDGLNNAATMVDEAGKLVTSAGEAASGVGGNVNGAFDIASNGLNGAITGADAGAAGADGQFDSDYGQMDWTFNGVVAENHEVLSTVEGDMSNSESQSDEAGAAMLVGVDHAAEELQAENVASFAHVDQAVNQASERLERKKTAVAGAAAELWQQGMDLHANLTEYSADTNGLVDEFDERIKTEKEALDSNVIVLQQQAQDTNAANQKIVDGIENDLVTEENAANAEFDDVEMTISGFGSEVEKMMNGPEFDALRKIMAADKFVEKQTSDNEELIDYLEGHEESSIPWMTNVLQSLSDEHETQLGNQASEEQAGNELADKEGSQAAQAFAAAQGVVSGAGAGQDMSELERMRLSFATTLEQNAVEAERDETRAQAQLQAEAAANEASSTGALSSADASLKKTTAAVSGASGGFKDLNDNIENILAMSVKKTADEHQNIASKGQALSDKVFFADLQKPGIDGVENDPATGALLQDAHGQHRHHSKAEMASLLQETARLSNMNKALVHDHASLGLQIEHLPEHGKKVNLR